MDKLSIPHFQGGTHAQPLEPQGSLEVRRLYTVGGVLTPGISRAQAILTDTKRITARDIQLNVGGTMIPAHDARPEAQGRYPIIVTISGFTGNNEHHKDVVRRFAHAGFYAISPELFHREGGMQGKNFQEMSRVSGQVTRAQYLGDLKAAADYAKQQSWARADRLGATGFCGGGATAMHFATEYPGVGAVVPWYGPLGPRYKDYTGDAWSLVDKLNMTILGLYGEADGGIPAADVKRFETDLKKKNSNVEFVLYPGTPHRFFSDDSPQSYKKDAAEDGWKRCIAFFTKHLKG